MNRIGRRAFLHTLARAGAATVALASLPPWARRALAAPPGMIVRNDWPEHLETSLTALGHAYITPNATFFVRNHLLPPAIDAAAWRLEIAGLVNTPYSLSLAELRAVDQSEAVHTLECAGNGRALMQLPSTSGTQWERGAVGNASWGGVRLATLLERAGVKPEAKHVWFEAADRDPLPTAPVFLRSVPIEKAMGDTLLAHTMNGVALPAAHGAPLRAIVPGWYGMASAKWVTKIRLEAAPSDNHFMAKGYRYAYPGEDPTTAAPVETLRVKSVITRPLDGARVPAGKLRVQGFAWAGTAGVRVVEISTDGGAHWLPAGVMGDNHPLAWRGWATQVPLERGATLTVMARATDNAGETQPLLARANAGGYGNNSIHVVKVHALG
jgi:sulfite oxidase